MTRLLEPYELTPEEAAELDASLDEAAQGEFATDEEVRAVWAKHGLGRNMQLESCVRAPGHRDDADRRLPVLLRLSALRHPAQAQAGRLLRLLFLRNHAVPADPDGRQGNVLHVIV